MRVFNGALAQLGARFAGSEEVTDHKVNVEPYDYHDRNCAITMKSDDFNKLISGKLDPVAAFTIGKLKVDGDVGKALEFSKLLKK